MITDIILIISIIALPAIAQFYITRTYGKYSDIDNGKNISGFEVARKILDANGLNNIDVVSTPGTLSDHYDPKRKVVRLSRDVFNGESVAAISIAQE